MTIFEVNHLQPLPILQRCDQRNMWQLPIKPNIMQRMHKVNLKLSASILFLFDAPWLKRDWFHTCPNSGCAQSTFQTEPKWVFHEALQVQVLLTSSLSHIWKIVVHFNTNFDYILFIEHWWLRHDYSNCSFLTFTCWSELHVAIRFPCLNKFYI